MLIALGVIINFFDSSEESTSTINSVPVDEFSIEDFDTSDTLGWEVATTHHRVWKDADASKRRLQFSFTPAMSDEAFYHRDTMLIDEGENEKIFWRNFYFGLYDHNKESLNPLKDSIISMGVTDNISAPDLIYTAVSMIQDIPYNYILSTDSCFTHTDYPCVPLQRYGILSPVEFLYSLSGDCDTRTVTLFTLLKNLGFDPIIVNSYQYRHSMLAVDVPTGGDFIMHKGRKFYFWETTATGWMPGMLPPDMPNTNYWTIILDYEFEADPTRNY